MLSYMSTEHHISKCRSTGQSTIVRRLRTQLERRLSGTHSVDVLDPVDIGELQKAGGEPPDRPR